MPSRFQEHSRDRKPRGAHRAIAFLTILICLISGTLVAQVLYGTLTGNVTDPSGAVVPNAKVEALNTLTGTTRTTATDANGVYRFQDIQAGTYKVTISSSGFATTVANDIVVTVNTIKRADAQLSVAQAQTIVEVKAQQQLLQTDKADVHTDLTSQQVDFLPTAGSQGRNFQSLLQIIPGAGLSDETNSLAGNPERAMNTNVNGQSNQGVNTRIDGAQDAYPWLPANVAYVPPSDAIQDVNVVTNSFDAEQGLAGGAAVNVQIKSGTNQFHGTADWFHTDQNFAARNFFNNASLPQFQNKNRNNQNQFGGTFGGPIVKDKIFFFVDYERTTQRQKAGPDVRTLPTAAMLTGDFRNLPGNAIIYDPATGSATGAGKQQISCNGVLNVICANRIDPAASAMIQLLQLSIKQEFTTANDLNNFAGSGTALFNRDNADIKVNFVPTDKTTAFARYSFSRILVFDPPLLGDAGGDATNGGQLGDAPGLIQSVGLGATHTFTPNMLLDWNFGYTRQRLAATFDLGSPKGLDLLKIPGTNGAGDPSNSNLYNGLPAFQVCLLPTCSSTTNFGNPNTGNPYLFRDNQFVTGANLSWTRGKHNFRGGVEYNPGHVSFFRREDGTLIAGDAFTTVDQKSMRDTLSQRQQVSSPPPYYTCDWESAQRSVQKLAELNPRVLACGHGIPMRGAQATTQLRALVNNFPIPEHGRYVREPARTDESGIVHLPPPVLDPVKIGAIAAAGIASSLAAFFLLKKRKAAAQPEAWEEAA